MRTRFYTLHMRQPIRCRYLRALQNVDLTNGFYFSYTYDLTHTLQFNFMQQRAQPGDEHLKENFSWGTRYQPTWKYVWNEYLQEPLRSQVHPRWLLFVVHGMLSSPIERWMNVVVVVGVILQYNLNVFCRSIYLTLICRRSQKYSGTRFLKRGGNSKVRRACRMKRGSHRCQCVGLRGQRSGNRTDCARRFALIVGQESFHFVRAVARQCARLLESRSQASTQTTHRQ